MRDGRWFSETLIPGMRLSFEAKDVLHYEKTAEQELALIDNEVFGRVLLLDGVVQLTTRDEFVYHEMMAHVPILGHERPRDVLIVGGGDCGLAEEVLKHAEVRSVTQVEIDAAVVQFSREHLAEINAPVFADPRFELIIADGAAFVRETERRFDVILVDSTDPLGPGAVLFTPEFYAGARRCLNPRGVLVTQNGVPFVQAAEFGDAMARLAATFPRTTCYTLAVPTYVGGHLALGWSDDGAAPAPPTAEALEARFAAAAIETRYYTPRVHAAAFVLPRYLEEAVTARTDPRVNTSPG